MTDAPEMTSASVSSTTSRTTHDDEGSHTESETLSTTKTHGADDAMRCPWPVLGGGLIRDVAVVQADVSALKEALRSRDLEIADLTSTLKTTIEELRALREALFELRKQGAVTQTKIKGVTLVAGMFLGYLIARIAELLIT